VFTHEVLRGAVEAAAQLLGIGLGSVRAEVVVATDAGHAPLACFAELVVQTRLVRTAARRGRPQLAVAADVGIQARVFGPPIALDAYPLEPAVAVPTTRRIRVGLDRTVLAVVVDAVVGVVPVSVFAELLE